VPGLVPDSESGWSRAGPTWSGWSGPAPTRDVTAWSGSVPGPAQTPSLSTGTGTQAVSPPESAWECAAAAQSADYDIQLELTSSLPGRNRDGCHSEPSRLPRSLTVIAAALSRSESESALSRRGRGAGDAE